MKKLALVRRYGLYFSHKIFLVMKICFIILFTGLIQLSASTFSQGRVSINVENESIREVFRQIKEQTGMYFVYNEESLDQNMLVTAQFIDEPLNNALTKVLKDSEYDFEISDYYVVIKPAKKIIVPIEVVQQQEITISGVVKDKSGEPIPGVNIMVKELKIGIVTDIHGKYELSGSIEQGNTIVFSFIGMKTQEIVYSGKLIINVTMESDMQGVNEVVVTGYQTIDKEKMTGSAKAFTAASIKNMGTTSVEAVLEGSMAGLNMTTTGRPGEDAVIEIRGVNSFTGNTQPMWIVDGMPMMGEVPSVTNSNELRAQAATTGIGNITPEDIESITVLKDAAAAAIYGAQAANGVIVITTKSGQVGKSTFTLTSNFDVVSRPDNPIEMMNSAEKIRYEEAYYYKIDDDLLGRASEIYRSMETKDITESEGERLLNELRNTNTDWFKEIFKTAKSHQHTLSLTGGNEKTQYYVSGSYLNEEGIEPNNEFNRFNSRMKLTHFANEKLKLTLGIGVNVRNNTQSSSVINPLHYAIYANPYEKPYNEDGSYAYDITYNGDVYNAIGNKDYYYRFNVIEDLTKNTKESRYLNTDLSLRLDYELLPGITYSLLGAYNMNSSHDRNEIYPETYSNYRQQWNPISGGAANYNLLDGSLTETTSRGSDYTIRNSIQLIKNLQGVHYVNIMVGQEIRKNENSTFRNYFPLYDPVHKIGGFPYLSEADVTKINFPYLGTTNFYETKKSSFFGAASYTYNNKYVISGSVRYDGTSFLGNKNNFTPLWNISGRWNAHNESFLKNIGVISLLAIKGGYGYTGSIDINAIPWTVLNYNDVYLYNDEVIPSSTSLPSFDLKWQTKEDKNIGLEVGLWDNRLQISSEYFHNVIRDVLERKKLSVSSGRQTVPANVGTIVNKGLELDLSSNIIQNRNLTWSVSANITFLEDEIQDAFFTSPDELAKSTVSHYVKGYPVRALYGYKFKKVNPSDGHVYITDKNGEEFDLNKGQVAARYDIELPPLEYLGDQTPSYTGGASTSVKYKQFTFRVNTDFKGGHLIPSFGINDAYHDNYNKPVFVADAWSQPGDVTDVPYVARSYQVHRRYNLDNEYEKGDYFRINLVSFGYFLKPEFTEKIGLKSARVNLNVRNVHTFTKYRGIDPTLMGRMAYPNTRRYSVSVNVSF